MKQDLILMGFGVSTKTGRYSVGCTSGGGINYLNPKKISSNFLSIMAIIRILYRRNCRLFFEDHAGLLIWIGT